MSGSGRARGRALSIPVPEGAARQSPPGGSASGSGSGGSSPHDGNGEGNGNGEGDGSGDTIRGKAGLHVGTRAGRLKTRPANKDSKSSPSAVGQAVELFANYFEVKANKENVIADYRVDFDPEVEMRKARREMIATQAALFGGAYVYDGNANLKSLTFLPDEVTEVTILNEATRKPVRITFRRGNAISWFDEEMLRFLNTQLRRNFDALKYLQIFRHYFNTSQTLDMPQYDFKIMKGLATAIAEHDKGLLMVCDTVSKIIQNKTVLDVMNKIRSQNPPNLYNAMRQLIPGRIVMTTYNNRTYKIHDIAEGKTAESTFNRKGIDVSYVKYYKDQYDKTINNPRQPLLMVNPTSREERFAKMAGRVAQPIYLVPELCVITGLTDEQANDFNLKRDMTQSTQLNPNQRFAAMKGFAGQLRGNEEVQASLNRWGVSYGNMPLAITGRQLPPESVLMADGQPQLVDKDTASFERQIRSKRMFNPGEAAKVDDWVIFVGRRNEADAKEFAEMLNRVSGPLGMSLQRPRLEVLPDDRASAFSDALQARTGNAKLVVCIVGNNDKSRYDVIKKFCYILKGVASQVVVARTLAKKQQLMSVCTKVGIQVATKLGAAPWSFKIPPKKLMVIGFDVHHDGARKGKSVGALVASLNDSLTQYYSRVVYHENKEECSSGVATLFRDALIRYRDLNNKVLPTTIIFYRDGVGDGMIKHVFDIEVAALRKVILEIAGNEKDVKFAFCIVTKRINTRFFKKLDKPNLGNPLPGTIVDGDVTRPERYEFYCVSQSVRAGTVSPTNYNIIYDTTPFKPENQQILVYKLTHLYFNWAGTIRVPAPCQYAHKLAFLTGTSLHAEASPAMATNLFYL